ncbi:unnamed protein product [Heligmosomoides polygyrus]|uniref:CRAL-TRIO domain-containing protein n=1 Tax=Heligmosomoides polygyrus TaxID=6339 RepID=A0A3P7YIA6_HELPZ|nr:unnamed protein product [Heligmosomoides polygyrus]
MNFPFMSSSYVGDDICASTLLHFLIALLGLWINLAQYRAGDTGFENVFIFWLERHTMDTKADPLTILIDMTGTSMMNMDLNIFKFILHALKYYYPNTVHDMIVFESPTMFNASWKVVRSWMDPAHPQLHHVTKDGITHFIDSKYLPLFFIAVA